MQARPPTRKQSNGNSRVIRNKLTSRQHLMPNNSGPFMANNKAGSIPQRMDKTFAYTSIGSLTSGASVFGSEYVFRLNSIYDPDYTGTGRQPWGHDQVATLYRNYLVKAVRLRIEIFDPSSDGLLFGATIGPGDSAYTLASQSPEDIAEKPYSMVKFVSSTGNQKCIITQHIDLAQINGLSRAQYQNQTSVYGAAVGANPTVVSWLRIALADLNATTNKTVFFRVDLQYITHLYDRNNQTTS